MYLNRALFGYLVIFGVSALLGLSIFADYNRSMTRARDHYIESGTSELKNAARKVETALKTTYRSMHLISSLPDIRRPTAQLGADNLRNRETIQQIFDNLRTVLPVSELFIIPAGLDPARQGRTPGNPGRGILRFSTNQVLAPAALRRLQAGGLPLPEPGAGLNQRDEQFTHEILMQLGFLGSGKSQSPLTIVTNPPMITSAEIITNDDAAYYYTGLEKDRLGYALAIPYYRMSGELAGTVVTVIRTAELAGLIPSDNYALLNKASGLIASNLSDIRRVSAQDQLKNAEPDPSVIFSGVEPLKLPDNTDGWQLWSALPDDRFYGGEAAQTATGWRNFSILALAATSLIVAALWWLATKNFRLVRDMNEMLQDRLAEHTVEIANLSSRDQLTGLLNRNSFEVKLAEICFDEEVISGFAVHRISIDSFRSTRNNFGHLAGEEILNIVAKRLFELMGPHDYAARLGDSDFVLIQSGGDLRDTAGEFAAALERVLSRTAQVSDRHIEMKVSIGIVRAPMDGGDPEILMSKAEIALQHAQSQDHLRFSFFREEYADELRQQVDLEEDLRHALAADQLRLFYQPIVDAQTFEVVEFEALMRWEHPTRGLLSPTQFIQIAEDIDLIDEIGEFAIRRACENAMTWPDHIRVAVNLSPLQFRNRDFADKVMSIVASSGLKPSRLELEITETVALDEGTGAALALQALRRIGIKIALDDFGTGFSSLSYLRSFPFDKIKIDRSFVTDMGSTPECGAIVKSVCVLAKELGMQVTAEGVETDEELKILQGLGCGLIQGYLFGKPLPFSETGATIYNVQVA